MAPGADKAKKCLAKGCRKMILFASFAFAVLFASKAYSQDIPADRDSLVRLISAKAIQLTEIDGAPFRIVHGPARFMHNNAYLLCDSAAWDVNSNVIDAMGHVKIIQNDAFLESEYATYLADENLVQFRGTQVRLYNKKGDQLKTQFLDYNTADSIATFYNGGSMRSAKGDIVEGLEGMYDVADRLFMFNDDVNMYSDSIYIYSDAAEYHSSVEVAMFSENTTAWKGRDTLFSNNVEYAARQKTLVLKADNYIATKDQELWAGWIDYHRETGNAELYDNVQVRDQAQSALFMGDKGVYVQNPMLIYLTDNAVAGMYSEEKTGVDSLTNRPIYKRDTLFLSGDTLKMWQVPMYQVDSSEVESARQRKELADLDPMIDIDRANREYLEAYKRNKANEGKIIPPPNANKPDSPDGQPQGPVSPDDQPQGPGINAPESSGQLPDRISPDGKKGLIRPDKEFKKPDQKTRDSLSLSKNSLAQNSDSLALTGDTLALSKDSLGVAVDSLPQVDSTAVTFMSVYHKVKLYRSDMRGICDSLIYTSIDSIARFYRNPALWSGEETQFTADSIQLSVRDNSIYKANLIENAFIISQEDSIHFHQIKSTEMVAFFRDNDVYRFDAMGGVQAMLFFREKDSSVTLMNQKECKLLTAKIKDQTIERVRYIENVKSDLHPTYQLPIEKQRLRDFKWRSDEMPKSRNELTDRKVKPSARGSLKKRHFPSFYHTRDFFPESYRKIMDQAKAITRQIREEDQAALERQRLKEERERAARNQEQIRKEQDEEGKRQVKMAEDEQRMMEEKQKELEKNEKDQKNEKNRENENKNKENDGPVMIYNRNNS